MKQGTRSLPLAVLRGAARPNVQMEVEGAVS